MAVGIQNRKTILRSNTGASAMIFALAAGALLILGASAIELGRISDSKSKLNSIVDAAALAGKKAESGALNLSPSAARTLAEQVAQQSFDGNKHQLNGLASNALATISWDADNSLRVVGTADTNLIFGQIFGLSGSPISIVPVRAVGVAAAGSNQYVEIAMVLDNTGSMFSKDGRPETRFTLLRGAATSFVNTAFDKMTVPNRLRISVIPWATSVNIKGANPLGWDKTAVAATIVPDKGSQIMPNAPINRMGDINQDAATLANQFAPVGWRGCISGNGESQIANDAPKPSMKWDALQVPPNQHRANWKPSKIIADTCTVCPPPTPGPPPGPPPPPPPPGQLDGNYIDRTKAKTRFANNGQSAARASFTVPMNAGLKNPIIGRDIQNVQAGCVTSPCMKEVCDNAYSWTSLNRCWQDSAKYYGPDPYKQGRRNSFIAADTNCLNTWSSCTASPMPEGSQAACAADPNEIAWNAGGGQWCSWVAPTAWDKFDPTVGPNINCPMPMLGLSGSRKQVLDSINLMSPVVGGTHADIGLRWGLRSLSPRNEWTNFFGNAGKAPQAFGAASGKKVMILITDGENTQATDFPGYWGCADTNAPGCTGTVDAATLNTRMLDWCTSIRTTHRVELYTVAVNVTNPAAVSLLAQCAGDPAKAFAVDAADLQSTLSNVASQIFSLRIKE